MEDKISFVDQSGEWETRKISILGALASFINQLSIGDDLTKISIPSVLLYPYSGLELGASKFLSWIHLLLQANKEDDPVKRLICVCRWFIAYTQKEKLGKKPYNPILAETHIAWVNHDGTSIKGITKFFSEQTSHHPPVSAVVMENTEENLKLYSTAEFSTAFHGNSVTAFTTGATVIQLKNLDEVYEMPRGMPNLGVKNVILGTRRHAWEGEVTILCAKTGYKAVLNYFEDGWWCINSVTGYITKIDSDSRLYTLQGPLDGVINLTNCQTTQAEVLLDLTKVTKQKISYLPFIKLSNTDSVKVWRELSEAIVVDDMLKADIAKRVVEDAQRKRRHDGTNYTPTYFTFNAETKKWVFKEERMDEINKRIATASDPITVETKEEVKEEVKEEGTQTEEETPSKTGEIVDVKV